MLDNILGYVLIFQLHIIVCSFLIYLSHSYRFGEMENLREKARWNNNKGVGGMAMDPTAEWLMDKLIKIYFLKIQFVFH